MDFFWMTFESIAMLLVIGCVGFIILSRKVLPESAFSFLSPLSLDIALPCLVFGNIISNFQPLAFPGWWLLPLWWTGFTVISSGAAFCFALVSRREVRKEFIVSLMYPNGIFFPLAILTGIFGNDSSHVVTLFLFVLFYPSFLFSTCHLFWKKPNQPVRWNRIFNTMLIVTLLATLVRLMDLQVYIPAFVLGGLKMVGSMTVPLLMLIIGGNIYVDFKNRRTILVRELILFLCVKNIAYPVIALGVLYLLHPPFMIALMILLQSAVPPVTAIPVIVEKEGGKRDVVNQFLFASALFSLITIPMAMVLLGRLYPGHF